MSQSKELTTTERLRAEFKENFGSLLGDLSVRKNKLTLRKEMQSYDEVARRRPVSFLGERINESNI